MTPIDFMVTLGHNSSVIVSDTQGNCLGYEEERLDRRKSSSAFPKNAFDAASFMGGETTVFVTHWFDQFVPKNVFESDKYFDKNRMPKGSRIVTHSPELTHHDAHAWSAVAFREAYSSEVPEGAVIVVADGFGNFQEVLSVYEWRYGSLRLKRRVFGYCNSVGLMYQFATELVGMRPHEDEYKFLGYMNHATTDAEALQESGRKLGHRIVSRWHREETPRYDESIGRRVDVNMLKIARAFWSDQIMGFANCGRVYEGNALRAAVGVVVQEALETAIMSVVGNPDHLLVAGGCFMNVRLNDRLSQAVKKSFTVMPLAGDQGAAIGMRRALTGRELPFGDLVWGARASFKDVCFNDLHAREIRVVKRDDFAGIAACLIDEGRIVNVYDMRGMEFGSRALCRTSTLARPTDDSVRLINRLNGRDTVMPMAPVMRRSMYKRLFRRSSEKIVGSEHFMITACSARGTEGEIVENTMQGAAHPDPFKHGVWSCRPQVVDSDDDLSHIDDLLKLVSDPCLINTSLNLHGEPIIFLLSDLVRLNDVWASKIPLEKFATIVIEED